MPIGIKPTVDFAFKKIFGSPENTLPLIGLLNAILNRPTPITRVHILNPFNRKEFLDDKLIVLDVKARDADGGWFNVEMQVSVATGLMSRMVYYACRLFSEQLEAGDAYHSLCPAISICLLSHPLFNDCQQPHHRFRLIDSASGRALEQAVEVHTVELTKYNLDEHTIRHAGPIEQWAFFLLYADQYDADELRELLPAVEFQQAITVIEDIGAITDDRMIYDERMKASRDYQWIINAARIDGLEEGLEKGHERGLVEGHEKGLAEGRNAGRVQGRRQGIGVGMVQALQQVLGEQPTPIEQLERLDEAEIQGLIQQLQDRIRTPDKNGDSDGDTTPPK